MTQRNIPTLERIDQFLHWSSGYLAQKSFPTPRLDSELLLSHVLECKRIDLYIQYDRPLSQKEKEKFKSLLIRRLKHEPIAYIIGHKEFMSLNFQMHPEVLIPRPETELLVEKVLEFQKTQEDKDFEIFEVGIGSGCIAVSLLYYMKKAKVLGWDISEKALEIAETNAKISNIEKDFYSFEKRNAFEEDHWKDLTLFDCIVSNPPYIADHEMEELPQSVKNFEPRTALFAEEDGLAFYKLFAKECKKHLKENGKVFLEIGASQAEAVTQILRSEEWKSVETFKDYAGKDRIIVASLESFDT